MKTMRCIPIIVGLMLYANVCAGAVTVTYVTAENVYINGGASNGIQPGTQLRVTRSGKDIATLTVVFSADHSASCTIVSSTATISTGDIIVVMADKKPVNPPQAQKEQVSAFDSATTATHVIQTPASENKAVASVAIDGNVALLYSVWNDNSDADLDYAHTALRISLNARRLFASDVTFRFRGRTRNDWRKNQPLDSPETDEWINQIWEFSFSYENPTSPFKAYAGRILPQRVSRIGYLDGLLAEFRLNDQFRAGTFAGARPDFMYAEHPQALSVGGGYVTWVKTTGDSIAIEQSIAGIGEYRGNVTNRESVALSGRIQKGNRWGFNESVEFDVNRSWRKVKAGSSVALSNVYCSAWMRFGASARVTGSYDNRTNYRTLVNYSVADSLFDDHLYQGARLMVESAIPWNCRVSGSVGMRKRPDRDTPTWTWTGTIRTGRLFMDGLSFRSNMTSFDGSVEHGSLYSAGLTKNIAASTVGITFGGYRYTTGVNQSATTNNWIECSTQTYVSGEWFLSGWLQNDFGDDMNGLRTTLELGYRF